MRGLSLFQQGDLLGSLDSLNNSRFLFESYGNKEDIAGVLMELGIAQRRLGNFDSAEKAYQDALSQWQISGNSMWQANVLNNLGFLQNLRGQYELAALSFERSLQHARLAVYPRMERFALTSLGDLYRDLRANIEARQAYQMAADVATQMQEHGLDISLILSNASVDRIEKNFISAEQSLRVAEEKAVASNSAYEIDLCKLERSALALASGKFGGIDQNLTYLSNIFERQSNLTDAYRANLLLAVLNFLNNNWVQGQSLLQDLYDSRLRDTAKNILLQVGLEFKEAFEKASQHLLGFTPVQHVLQQVNDFEGKAPEIRRAIKRQNNVIQFLTYQVSVRAFGRMQVRVGDHLVSTSDWKSQTSRDLFFYLLAHPGGVTKEEVGAAFWPDSTPDELRLRFKNSVYRLRRAIGNDAVTYTDETYEFNRAIDYEYDVERFLREINLAQASDDMDAQIKQLKAAINLYQGPFLPKGEQSWILSQREQYQQIFIDSAVKLANLLMQQGHHHSAIQYSKRVLDQDSCNEAAHRLIMLTYASMEDRSAVKRQFELCRQTLLTELGVEPNETTRNLYETLMR